MNSVWTKGKVCGGVAGALLSVTFAIAFPLIALKFLGVLALVVMGMLSLFGAIVLGLKIGSFIPCPKFFRHLNGSNVLAAFFSLALAFIALCLVNLFWGLFEPLWAAFQGRPVDDFGTVISVGPFGLSLMLGASVVGAVCWHIHFCRPRVFLEMSKGESPVNRWISELTALQLSVAMYFFAVAFVSMIIYSLEREGNPVFEDQQLSIKIERIEQQIKALEARKKELIVPADR